MQTKKITYQTTLSLIFFILAFTQVYAQEVEAKIDRDTIKIGEQVKYTITAKVQPDDVIEFPEGQTFTPLEMVEAYKIDTTQLEPLKILSKTYALTQFDSGRYTIGRQTLKVNESFVETDTIAIKVNDVIVDTTKQKLYPIKTYIDIEKPFEISNWIWWTLLAIIVVVGLIYLIFRLRDKKDQKKKRIPPYQKAIQSLQALDQSDLIESRNLKEYYSKLTEISRRYLEEKVEIRAMEYTSNELVDELENRRSSQKLNINQDLIDDFKKVLQRADLAKFAKSAPDVITAKSDRKNIESFTNSMQTAIPEPTEEEKKRDEAYQAILKKRRQQRKIVFAVIGVVAVMVITTVALVATKGYDYVRDAYFGNASKEMLESDWITSSYGFPPMEISTPDVLVRKTSKELDVMVAQNEFAIDYEIFEKGTPFSDLSVTVSSIQFKEGTEFDINKSIEGVLAEFEKQGAYNILNKQSEFETLDGTDGIQITGSYNIKNPITQNDIKKSYNVLIFYLGSYMSSVTIIHNENDQYADEINNRIVNTIEFKLDDR